VQVALYALGGAYSIRIRFPLENVDYSFITKLSFDKVLAKEIDALAEK